MMPVEYTNDYLLDKKVQILQPVDGYRASSDAVLLAAMVSADFKGRILDVGAGTGAVSLCLAQRLPKRPLEIIGLELQPELAELAAASAKLNNFDFLHYYQADINEKIDIAACQPCSFDAVITNPPYSEHDLASPNRSKAAAHNHQALDLAGWLAFCLKMAKPFGKIYLINRAEAIAPICHLLHGKAGGITVLPIYSKADQSAKRVIICAQKDAKTPARILPPFVVHDAAGQYTPAAQKILREGRGFADILPIL